MDYNEEHFLTDTLIGDPYFDNDQSPPDVLVRIKYRVHVLKHMDELGFKCDEADIEKILMPIADDLRFAKIAVFTKDEVDPSPAASVRKGPAASVRKGPAASVLKGPAEWPVKPKPPADVWASEHVWKYKLRAMGGETLLQERLRQRARLDEGKLRQLNTRYEKDSVLHKIIQDLPDGRYFAQVHSTRWGIYRVIFDYKSKLYEHDSTKKDDSAIEGVSNNVFDWWTHDGNEPLDELANRDNVNRLGELVLVNIARMNAWGKAMYLKDVSVYGGNKRRRTRRR